MPEDTILTMYPRKFPIPQDEDRDPPPQFHYDYSNFPQDSTVESHSVVSGSTLSLLPRFVDSYDERGAPTTMMAIHNSILESDDDSDDESDYYYDDDSSQDNGLNSSNDDAHDYEYDHFVEGTTPHDFIRFQRRNTSATAKFSRLLGCHCAEVHLDNSGSGTAATTAFEPEDSSTSLFSSSLATQFVSSWTTQLGGMLQEQYQKYYPTTGKSAGGEGSMTIVPFATPISEDENSSSSNDGHSPNPSRQRTFRHSNRSKTSRSGRSRPSSSSSKSKKPLTRRCLNQESLPLARPNIRALA